jgi:hypothetical protein
MIYYDIRPIKKCNRNATEMQRKPCLGTTCSYDYDHSILACFDHTNNIIVLWSLVYDDIVSVKSATEMQRKTYLNTTYSIAYDLSILACFDHTNNIIASWSLVYHVIVSIKKCNRNATEMQRKTYLGTTYSYAYDLSILAYFDYTNNIIEPHPLIYDDIVSVKKCNRNATEMQRKPYLMTTCSYDYDHSILACFDHTNNIIVSRTLVYDDIVSVKKCNRNAT